MYVLLVAHSAQLASCILALRAGESANAQGSELSYPPRGLKVMAAVDAAMLESTATPRQYINSGQFG